MKGNKPDFHNAMGGDEAKKLFDLFLSELSAGKEPYFAIHFSFWFCLGYNKDKIQTGVFGAMMKVELENDGPVTIEVNSPEQKPDKSKEEKTDWFWP